MIPYKKILITTDGSEKSGPAMIYGLCMAKAMGADVGALSVIDESDYEDMMSVAIPEAESVLYQQSVEAAESIVAQGRSKGVQVKPIIVSGIPASKIAEISLEYDLTIMGTVGRKGLTHLLLGSVAEKVVRTAKSPVLVVHAGDHVNADCLNVKRILIPTDGSENTKPAIAHGLALARVLNAEVTVLNVADQTSENQSSNKKGDAKNQIEISREATESIANEGKRMGLTAHPLTLTGTPINEIVKASSNFDLIVMGTVGRTGLAHIRLGSVAEGTVRQAKCPVLVVRAKS